MPPFEFSSIDIIVFIAIIFLFVIFVAALIRLKPSDERELVVEEEKDLIKDRMQSLPQDQVQSKHPIISKTTQTDVSESKLLEPKIRVNTTIESPTTQVEAEAEHTPKFSQSPMVDDNEEKSRVAELPLQAQTKTRSAETDCAHFFGYLMKLPKNTHIPDECFGCPKIVECLVTSKKK